MRSSASPGAAGHNGRCTDGKGLDAWMSAQSDPNSGPAMLMARFRECVTNQSRAGYITR
jgi:hypothetical protein